MKTRSQTRNNLDIQPRPPIVIRRSPRLQQKNNTSTQNSLHLCLYEVDIDFDEASKAWRQNKISLGNGTYDYKT